MTGAKAILVCGATGTQGGAVARSLLDAGYPVRALTRDRTQDRARALEQAGANVVEGDLNDRASLERAVDGVNGVFSVQNFWETGYEMEVEQGKRMADVAREAGVEHLVYSSVGGADRDSGLSHFESKHEIEEHIRSIGQAHTILRPVFFMDNWEADMMKGMVMGGSLYQPLSPDTRLQQIDAADIGTFARIAFDDPDEWIGRAIELAGDDPTMDEIAATFSRVIGRDVSYVQVGWDDFREQAGDEYAEMYRWFEDEGYEADIAGLRRIHPGLTRFEDYFVAHGWKGAAAEG